jgi:uncharacterized phage protein (TIGR01671 family)
MKREIKFRAWDSKKKEWIDSFQIYSDSGKIVGKNHAYGNINLVQYTGLKDKNGVEIYEGDVVNAFCYIITVDHDFSEARKYVSSNIKDTTKRVDTRARFKVYWNDSFSQYSFKCIDNTDAYICIDVSEREYEVIGNIHENKELL